MKREILSVAALAASLVAYDSYSNSDKTAKPAVIEQGVDDYSISSLPALEQFQTCLAEPEAVYVDFPTEKELRIGNGEWVLSLQHIVGPTDTVQSISRCYFEQSEIGLLSLKAANPELDLSNLEAGDSVEVNLSSAMWFNVGTETESRQIARKTGLRLPLVEVLLERDDSNEEIVLFPKQEPCVAGELYYIVQTGDSLDTIASAFGDVADDVYAFNAIGPEMLRAGQVLRISTRGYMNADNFTPPPNGFWYINQ